MPAKRSLSPSFALPVAKAPLWAFFGLSATAGVLMKRRKQVQSVQPLETEMEIFDSDCESLVERDLRLLLTSLTRQIGSARKALQSRPGRADVAVQSCPPSSSSSSSRTPEVPVVEERAVVVPHVLLMELQRLLDRAAAAEELAEQRSAECESLRTLLRALANSGQCPILLGPWTDPVVASDGYTYERSVIEDWMLHSPTSPITRALLRLPLYSNRYALEIRQLLCEMGLEPGREHVEPAEAQDLPEGALLNAIKGGERATSLSYLRRHPLPGLNAVSRDGSTVLHWAISKELPDVANAVLMREDFRVVNSATRRGETALHWAATRGYLPVCQAILAREDFVGLQALTGSGVTALELAMSRGHGHVALFLRSMQ